MTNWARVNVRRLYEGIVRKRGPLEVELEWSAEDALAVILGNRAAAASIAAELRERPDLLDQPAAGVVRDLAGLEHVGPAAAVRYVAAEVWRGRAPDLAGD